ncbi:hypothetical protein BKH43_06650 [Helicobacter sp. 13S00401-1]|nr:hypothetical protein BKH43_06650 [Helicobacter sp. 13S00401-1]
MQGESEFFKSGFFTKSFFSNSPFCIDNFQGDFDIVGFSKGANEAFSLALSKIQKGERVTNLVLISPALFSAKDSKFKAMQLALFKKDAFKYMDSFLGRAGIKVQKDMNVTNYMLDDVDVSRYIKLGSTKELESLLNYSYEGLKDIASKARIYIILGGKDSIIESSFVCEFFKKHASVIYAKSYNHFLIKGE